VAESGNVVPARALVSRSCPVAATSACAFAGTLKSANPRNVCWTRERYARPKRVPANGSYIMPRFQPRLQSVPVSLMNASAFCGLKPSALHAAGGRCCNVTHAVPRSRKFVSFTCAYWTLKPAPSHTWSSNR